MSDSVTGPRTGAGRAAVKAIKSGALVMWADDPDDPIAAMIGDVERAAADELPCRCGRPWGEHEVHYPSATTAEQDAEAMHAD